jgi:hypothetical protein
MRAAMFLVRASLLLPLVTGGCTKRVEVRPMAAMGPALAVEQFLGAVNTQDYIRMSNLFGTKEGPILGRDPRENVEKQMFLLATVLRHEDYEVKGEQAVPGRLSEATQLNVSLTLNQKKIMVPFVMVRGKNDKWLVECIEIENVTNPSGTPSTPCIAK